MEDHGEKNLVRRLFIFLARTDLSERQTLETRRQICLPENEDGNAIYAMLQANLMQMPVAKGEKKTHKKTTLARRTAAKICKQNSNNHQINHPDRFYHNRKADSSAPMMIVYQTLSDTLPLTEYTPPCDSIGED